MTAALPISEHGNERAPGQAQPRLEAVCPSCGVSNRSAAKFCIGCIGPLRGIPARAQAQATPAPTYVATVACPRTEQAGEIDRGWTTVLSRRALPAGTTIEGFQVLRALGEGGFGIVYLAWDSVLERHVALKEYMPATLAIRNAESLGVSMRSERHRGTFDAGLRSFLNEARLLARFDHPALLKVFRFWEGNGTAYMAMPYYEGPTLREALAGESSVPSEEQLREWLKPLLDALTVLHRENCLHRDIAPDNILLTDTGPVLLDFGAARRVISDMTQGPTAVLKPGFAPIEQYGGALSQGPWTDLYALAGVVYYSITGQLPPASAARVVSDGYRPLAKSYGGVYTDRFLHAIDTALSLRPEARPQDVAQFRALIDSEPADACRHASGSVSHPATEAGPAPAVADTTRASVETGASEPERSTPSSPDSRPELTRMRSRKVLRQALLLALLLTCGAGWWFGMRQTPAAGAASAPSTPTAATRPAAQPAAQQTAQPAALQAAMPAANPVPPEQPTGKATRTLPPSLPARPLDPAIRQTPARAAQAKPAPVVVPSGAPERASASTASPEQSDNRPQRCGDLVLKSSLDSLSPEEISFQKSQCK